MTRYWLASVTAFAMMMSGAVAQSPSFDATNSTQPNMSTNGPAGTYDTITTRRTIDSSGAISNTTESFDKSQTYTSGDGALSAKTSIQTTGPATTITMPPVSTSTKSTTTTTEEIRP